MDTGSVPNRLGDKGFNLIEVLIAMIILSVGMLGTASLIVGVVRGNQASKHVTTATTLAQDTMEQILNAGWSGLPSSNSTATQDYGQISGYDNYKRVTTITVNSPASRMATIQVDVHWQTGTNPVTLNTVIVR